MSATLYELRLALRPDHDASGILAEAIDELESLRKRVVELEQQIEAMEWAACETEW